MWLHTEEIEDQNELFEHFRFTADKGQNPLRIDKFLLHKLEDTSRTKIKAAADAGCIKVNNNLVKANYKVKPLDEIVIFLSYPKISSRLCKYKDRLSIWLLPLNI